jgi:hypothetical protein
MKLRLVAAMAAASALAMTATHASALSLAVDTGWVSDQIDAAFTDSEDTPIEFTLAGQGVFRLTDQFLTGDTYYVYDSASHNLLGTSSLNGAQAALTPVGDANGEAGWESDVYQHLELLLGPGSYSLAVQGDGAGGLPAGLYIRADTAGGVPEPATWALMLTGFFGAGATMRSVRRAALA